MPAAWWRSAPRRRGLARPRLESCFKRKSGPAGRPLRDSGSRQALASLGVLLPPGPAVPPLRNERAFPSDLTSPASTKNLGPQCLRRPDPRAPRPPRRPASVARRGPAPMVPYTLPPKAPGESAGDCRPNLVLNNPTSSHKHLKFNSPNPWPRARDPRGRCRRRAGPAGQASGPQASESRKQLLRNKSNLFEGRGWGQARFRCPVC